MKKRLSTIKNTVAVLAVILILCLAAGCGRRGSDISDSDTVEASVNSDGEETTYVDSSDSEEDAAKASEDGENDSEAGEDAAKADKDAVEAGNDASDSGKDTSEAGKDSAVNAADKDAEAAKTGDDGAAVITAEPLSEEDLLPVTNGHLVAIDAGHQEHGNSEQEPIGPGASATKPKVASGTHGPTSGLNEYELNLIVALQLRDELKTRGYGVVMIRETHDVNISNRERAEIANEAGADILVRIHANGADDTSVHGALCYEPSSGNQYLPADVIEKSQTLSRDIIDSFCETTGAKNLGTLAGDDMTGINWSKIPVTIVEMGFMTNPDEDLSMSQPEYQNLMVQGICDGIDTYFGITGDADPAETQAAASAE